MAQPPERSIFDNILLPRESRNGIKLLLGVASGVGVAALLVVGALAATGGSDPSRQTFRAEPTTSVVLLADAVGAGQTQAFALGAQSETATPTPSVAPTQAPTATSTSVPPTAVPPTATAAVPSPDQALALTADTSSPPQPAALLVAVTPTPGTSSLSQPATATLVPTLTPTITVTATATRTPTATATRAPASSSSSLPELEQELLRYHNEERTARGLKALTIDADAQSVARSRANEMADTGEFTHSPSTGNDYGTLLKKTNARYSTRGENISYNSGYLITRTAHVSMYGPEGDGGLFNSPGHRANILSKDFTRIGIGAARDGNAYYYAMIFLGP